MIKLMKSTFYNEEDTKNKLCDFIKDSKRLSMDEKCHEFEKRFSIYQNRLFSIFFNSGSSANLALLQSLINCGRLRRGDSVGISAITWSTNVMPILQLGLKPIPIDISLSNLNVSSENLVNVLETVDMQLLFVTNLMGFCGDLDNISRICKDKGIILLEDNCESLGSELNEIKLGNYGLASTFSFFVGHHLSTIEGGMVSTDDEELYDMLLIVRAHGWDRSLNNTKKNMLRAKYSIDNFYSKYSFYFLAYNLRPTEINAFIGLEQLKYLEEMNNIRNKNYFIFDKFVKLNPDFLFIDLSHMSFISNFAYPLLCKNKKIFIKYKSSFNNNEVEVRPIAGGYIVDQPFFKDYLNDHDLNYNCPNAKVVGTTSFYFPNNPELSDNEISLINKLLKS